MYETCFVEPQAGEGEPWADLLARLECDYRASEGRDLRYRDALDMLHREGRRRDYPVVSRNFVRQGWYVAMRVDGTPHKLAEMFALQRPPSAMTDREFLEGHVNGNQFEGQPWMGDRYRKEAEVAGVDPKGKIYVSGLAAFPGDPMAWVGGRGDVRRVCEARGLTSSGAVNYTPGQRDPQADVLVADDLVAARMVDRIEQDPGLAFRDRDEVFHETRESMKPHWSG